MYQGRMHLAKDVVLCPSCQPLEMN
jgi:hypothetical protein